MRKDNLLVGILFLLTIFLLMPFANALICDTDPGLQSDGSDFFHVNTVTANRTSFGANEKFYAFTAFTPRLNFTKVVYDFVTGGLTGTNTPFTWIIMGDNLSAINSTFSVYNVTLASPIGAGNYTVINISANLFYVRWLTDEFNGTSMILKYNRTFVKNVDDLVLTPENIYTGATVPSFLTITTGDFGDDVTFKMSNLLGASLNDTNWAVTWDYQTRTCLDAGCNAGATSTLWNVIATFFMIGMLVFIAFSLYNMDGGFDIKTIIMSVVVFLVMIVSLVIINGLIKNICT